MPTDDIAISVRNLTKTYRIFGHPGDGLKQAMTLGLRHYHREFTALKDVSFDIRKGETVGIIGPNGSGKSTLLQLICGILKPTSGSANVSGRVSALLELGSGFNPEFTGRENVYFQGVLIGFMKHEMDELFADIAAFADIGEFIDQPVRMYSSGMFVRLAFAAAIHVSPNIFVVDEALAVGDAAFQAKCYGRLRTLRASNLTILFVSHDLNAIANLCDRAVLLDSGRVAMIDSPKQVIDFYRSSHSTMRTRPAEARGEVALPTSAFRLNFDEHRYGDGLAEIVDCGLFTADGLATQVIGRGDHCRIEIRVRVLSELNHPVLVFVIKDLKGVVLCGSSSDMEGMHLSPATSGDTIKLCFALAVPLNPGNYLLSVGCHSTGQNGDLLHHDVRTDVLPFEITGSARYGLFCPPIELHRA